MPDIEVLRDPMWQFWGVVVGILAVIVTIIVAFVIYRLQQNRKELTYKIVSATPLVSVAMPYAGRIKVLWDDLPIPDVSLVVVSLANTGNKEIRTGDFEGPIKVTFPEAKKILSAEVNKTTPVSLEPNLTIDGSAVEIAPCLLNSRDAMTLAFLVVSFKNGIEVSARIAGVETIKQREAGASFRLIALLSIYFAFITTIVVFIRLIGEGSIPSAAATFLFVIIVFSVVIAFLLQLFALRTEVYRQTSDD